MRTLGLEVVCIITTPPVSLTEVNRTDGTGKFGILGEAAWKP